MKLRDLEKVFMAFSDTTRFRILSLLQEGELCVCDVMSVLKEPQSKISRHLAYLRKASLVKARKKGLWMYYSLTRPSIRTVKAVFGALEHACLEYDELKKDKKEFQKSKNCLVACCE